MVALAFACYRTAYGPVVRARGAVETARSALAENRTDRAERYFRMAAVADPWAAPPLGGLASLSLERWHQERDPAALARFEQYLDESLRRSPLSSSAWETAGDWWSGVFARTGDREHLDRAVAMYRRAVELYPTSATGRAKLAVALNAAGRRGEARREAREALRLHGLTPHADKKLPDELRGPVDRLASPRSEEP
jgi:tetratricopeptide (TPR) repeat protein